MYALEFLFEILFNLGKNVRETAKWVDGNREEPSKRAWMIAWLIVLAVLAIAVILVIREAKAL